MERNKGTAATRAKNKYSKQNYDDLRVQVKKGRREQIRAHAANQGESVNGYINRLIEQDMHFTEEDEK